MGKKKSKRGVACCRCVYYDHIADRYGACRNQFHSLAGEIPIVHGTVYRNCSLFEDSDITNWKTSQNRKIRIEMLIAVLGAMILVVLIIYLFKWVGAMQ